MPWVRGWREVVAKIFCTLKLNKTRQGASSNPARANEFFVGVSSIRVKTNQCDYVNELVKNLEFILNSKCCQTCMSCLTPTDKGT